MRHAIKKDKTIALSKFQKGLKDNLIREIVLKDMSIFDKA
jgi:hypothetical protein